MARKPKRHRPAPDEPMEQIGTPALRRIAQGQHIHVAEIHGEAVTAGLRPWARRAVLSGVSA